MDSIRVAIFASLISLFSGSIVIPFNFDVNGGPVMSFRIPRVFGNASVSGYLCGGFSVPSSFQIRDDSSGIQSWIMRNEVLVAESDSGPFEFNVYEFTSTMGSFTAPHTPITFSIGRQSSFLQHQSGSVDYVRNGTSGGFIRINSTTQRFVSDACAAESLMEVETPVSPGSHSLSSAVRFEGEDGTVNLELVIESTCFIVGLPPGKYRYIERISNATPILGQPSRIPNCDEALTVLPIINIRFIFSRESEGVLKLFPEDYTRRSTTDFEACELLINENYGSRAPFNPLLISGINVRFQRDRVMLCDTP